VVGREPLNPDAADDLDERKSKVDQHEDPVGDGQREWQAQRRRRGTFDIADVLLRHTVVKQVQGLHDEQDGESGAGPAR